MEIHSNLEQLKLVAIEHAKAHGCNYNIIIHNPDAEGKFNEASGSTYEYVADSYFEKDRPNAKLLHRTDDLLGFSKIESRPGKHFEDDGCYAE
ncbi:MAG TPA: hypothetical protein VGC65_00225 [Bacteroidia bacterium]|jgi:hypothetical protein